MFQHHKKDYFIVNQDIAIEANQQQRAYELREMAEVMQTQQRGTYQEGDDHNSFI